MAQSDSEFAHANFSDPLAAQHNFTNQYDLGNPRRAMSVYSRVMHQHTKQQLDMATSSARRRSQSSPTNAYNPAATSMTSLNSTAS